MLTSLFVYIHVPHLRPQRAASFAAEKMQGYVLRSKAFKGKDFLAALQQAFHDCETDFIQLAGREGLRDGTTALVALVQEEELTVAHVGDSRGVLCRKGGKTVAITQDHKPELEPEKKRIEVRPGQPARLLQRRQRRRHCCRRCHA